MVNIYKLLHPVTKEIRYIGKTKEALNRRLNKHIYNRGTNSKVSKWCKHLHKEGLNPIIELVERVSFQNWEEREKYWIDYYRSLGSNLLNITPGGDCGSEGYRHTKEAKSRISFLNSRPKSKEWMEKAAEEMRKVRATPILQYGKDGSFIKKWKSFYEAAYILHPENPRAFIKNVHQCCNNKRKSGYGFNWKYESIESEDKELQR